MRSSNWTRFRKRKGTWNSWRTFSSRESRPKIYYEPEKSWFCEHSCCFLKLLWRLFCWPTIVEGISINVKKSGLKSWTQQILEQMTPNLELCEISHCIKKWTFGSKCAECIRAVVIFATHITLEFTPFFAKINVHWPKCNGGVLDAHEHIFVLS